MVRTPQQRARHIGWALAAVVCLATALSASSPPDQSASPGGAAAKDMVTPDTQKAIDRGLAYLAGSQQRDGSWGERQYDANVAITSLAGLAFMSGGHQPGRGPYGRVVARALEYVLSRESSQRPGFLYYAGGNTHGPMYSHGFGTLFLAEAHGMVTDRDLRRRVRDTLGRAVRVIVDSQNREGGWRYQPERDQADVSVTICQIMALRAARNAGVEVPKSVADLCIEYVKACQTPDGGFRYLKQFGGPEFARSAAGVVALYSAGLYQDPAIERGLKYLMQFKPSGQPARGREYLLHYYYGHYYAAQAMWVAGGHYWAEWFPAIRDELVARIGVEGAWNDPTIGKDYATAMACIILQVPNNFLPIMQK